MQKDKILKKKLVKAFLLPQHFYVILFGKGGIFDLKLLIQQNLVV
jgi:hypothetical protein